MASKEKLIIHSLKFEITIDSQEDFKHYADRISNLTKNILPSRLNSVFDNFDLPEGNLIIKTLSIDLGHILPKTFEMTITDAIVYEIENFLAKNIKKIKHEISQSQFKASFGGKYEVQETEFIFESEIVIPKSTVLNEETRIREKELINLNEAIAKEGFVSEKKKKQKIKSVIKSQQKGLKTKEEILEAEIHTQQTPQIISREEVNLKTPEISKLKAVKIELKAEKEITSPKVILQNRILELQLLQNDKAENPKERMPHTPKALTPLDKALIYYLRYGRLPSNVKYELGTSMLDVFNINRQDESFLDELSNQIKYDDQAKERLVRLLDQKNQDSDFDPRVPKAFEDYFTALLHDLPTEMFIAGIRRYDLNDMIRFLYADNPNKLKNLIRYLILEYPSELDWTDVVDNLFIRISKPSVVKLISSFASKGAYLNKDLNELNHKSGGDKKSAHKRLFKLLVSDGDTNIFDFEVKPRKYFREGPKYGEQTYDTSNLVDYFLNYGSIPYTGGIKSNLDRINFAILTLGPSQVSRLSFFKNKEDINYESIGNLSEKAVRHLIKSLNPNLEGDIKNKYLYFKYNIDSGVPEKFQKAFMLHYALKENRKSYLEEMINYWKEQFGDADNILRERWKVKDELGKELNTLLSLTSKKVEDEIKVDFTYDSYAKDISVKNAGLVILWPFLKVYFNLLELLNEEGNFRSLKERARACHLLQYLAIQRSYGEEFYYPLNKILTGYPLDEPLPYEITMTKKEIDVSNALLKNVIKQWNALKGSSVDGLRGSFLIRNGILVPSPNGWLLTVENKAYDIIMNKLPWGIGMIKLSWAPYVLNVEWERNIM